MSGVYRGYSAAQLEDLYNQSPSVPDFPRIVAGWDERSAAVAAAYGHRADVAYGEGPFQDLTFFPPVSRARLATGDVLAAGVLFIHGGYWQELYKESWLYLAPAFLETGVAYIALNYALAPAVTLDEIVQEMRRAVAWVWRHAVELHLDRDRLYVAGHSAGAHLAVMLLLTDWPAFAPDLPSTPLRGACAVSGVYDLEPLLHTSVNDALGLDGAAAQRNSPFHLLAEEAALEAGSESGEKVGRGGGCSVPLILAGGGLESIEFRRQQNALAERWAASGRPLRVVDMPGFHHFNVVDEMAREGSPLYEALMAMVEGRWPAA